MHRGSPCRWAIAIVLVVCVRMTVVGQIQAQPPVLQAVYPAGGQAGTTVEVTISGGPLLPGGTLHSNLPGVVCEPLDDNRFQLAIPQNARPGMYDLWAVSPQGISSPRSFFVGNRPEHLEVEPNESLESAVPVPRNCVINGRLQQGGDRDCFRFEARAGQRVVIECWAERIDARLRAVLELYDMEGRRLAVNRGYFAADPLIDFSVPRDGSYVVRVQDLVFSGSDEHYYRLDIDTGPRVAFAFPTAVARGSTSHVTLYGWNLAGSTSLPASALPHGSEATVAPRAFDRLDIELPAAASQSAWPLPVIQAPAQVVCESLAYHLPGSHASIAIPVTDAPLVIDNDRNHAPSEAQDLSYPCDISGRLAAVGEQDWYALSVPRGEVLYFESFGQRIGSPVDLELAILDASGESVLARMRDERHDVVGSSIRTSHLDASGRWVAPQDGRVLLCVRSVDGGASEDTRRVYRLTVRREVPTFDLLAAIPGEGPSGLNVSRGGRTRLDVLCIRQRGCKASIRVTARNLPAGVECPDVWLGPGVERTSLVVSAQPHAPLGLAHLQLEGVADDPPAGRIVKQVKAAAVVRGGVPVSWGRLASALPFAVAGDAPLRITANNHATLEHHLYGTLQVQHAPGSVLDVRVQVDRQDAAHQAPVHLVGESLPPDLENQTTTMAAGESEGHLSFYLPPTMSPGIYSLTIRAETTVPAADGKHVAITVHSNPVVFEVKSAAFYVDVDPFVPRRARRGDVIQIGYSARRQNGFLGKLHTELAAPGIVTDVPGLLARGETFVGQTERGSLQVTINHDAPLGRHRFLRLFTVGVVEDEPVYFGSRILELEIIE